MIETRGQRPSIHAMAAPPSAPQGGPSPAQSGETPGDANTILVVEDDYFVALTIETTLSDAGYAVEAVVDSGEAALSLTEICAPDLVVMDIRLSGKLDGIDTAIRLRARGITCLFASAHSDAQTMSRGAAAEPAGWLVKPFTGEELLSAVASALDRHSSNPDRC